MAQLVVRNIEDDVKSRLQRRARRNRRSMEEEVREILRAAVHEKEKKPLYGLWTELASLFADVGLDEPIQELRGFTVEPPDFGE
jgi:plasmid stability protein